MLFDAQRIERESPVFVELKEGAVISIRSIATRLPENNAGTELANEVVSSAFASTCTQRIHGRSFRATEAAINATIRLAKMDFMTNC